MICFNSLKTYQIYFNAGEHMPIEIDGRIYYRTSETCKKAGVSRATLFRWLKAGILNKHHKDRRGWNLFTEEDIAKIRDEAKIVNIEEVYQPIYIVRKKSNISQNQIRYTLIGEI